MPIRRDKIINSEIYHIVHRRIGNELMFKDIDDYYRGIFSIYEFNNEKPVNIKERRRLRLIEKSRGPASGSLENQGGEDLTNDPRDRMVNVLCFCLMPNHIHLLLRQLKNNGITKFMNKFGTGYSSYFHEKYNLKGRGYFFQGRFKSILIKNNDQFKTIFVYIHNNPISLIEPNWKEEGVKDISKAINFLEDHKWSSYPDYIGKKNFPSIIKEEKENVLNIMGGEKSSKEFVGDWLRYKKEFKDFSLLLE